VSVVVCTDEDHENRDDRRNGRENVNTKKQGTGIMSYLTVCSCC